MGTGELLGKPNKLRGSDLQWTSIPSRGSRNTSSRFLLQKQASHTQYVCYKPLLLSQLNFLQFSVQLERRCSPPRRAFPSSCLVFARGIRTFLAISCSDNFHKTCHSQVAWTPGNLYKSLATECKNEYGLEK